MNRILLFLFCAGLIGCATTTLNKYADFYNQEVSSGHGVEIVKEGDLTFIQEAMEQESGDVGYSKILYTNPAQQFMVMTKDNNFGSKLVVGDKRVRKIILKYTNLAEGKTQIDLVDGNTETDIRAEVDKDIRKLADLIRND